jgi:hypothetical protein
MGKVSRHPRSISHWMKFSCGEVSLSDIREFNVDEWRSIMSIVPQDPILFEVRCRPQQRR